MAYDVALVGEGETQVKLAMTARDCPICGSSSSTLFAEENFDPETWDSFAFASRKLPEYMHYRLVECTSCDLVYANPAPDGGSLGEAYRQAAYDSAEEAAFAARTYAGFLPSILSRLPRRGRALDIGAGDGAFVEQLVRAGFSDPVGVEPSTAPIESARPEIRKLIRQGLFSAGDFEPQSLSLVTCFQTIEHLPDPGEMFRQVHGLLEEGGAIFVVGHNRRALSARILGLKSPIFDIEHLQLISPSSLRRALESTGYTDVSVKTVRNRYPLKYWARLFPLPEGVKSRVLGFLGRNPMGALPISLPAGNMAAIGYRRSEP
ncbi:MAG TPA: class I SAM-dependent methyltransferase [Actinomycetota bacterium]|nr:class I SAM-dependent methyltransferase [Actinomycetota bacterium]